MNEPTAKQLLVELGEAASRMSEICAREQMQQFAPFWDSVAGGASSLSLAPSRDELHRLVRDVLAEYRYVRGGFMDMYVVRADSNEQVRENDAFDALRNKIRLLAEKLYDAADENEVDPLKIRRALVELESQLLDKGAGDAAGRVRELLNRAELRVEAVSSLCAEFQAHPPIAGTALNDALGRLHAALEPSRLHVT